MYGIFWNEIPLGKDFLHKELAENQQGGQNLVPIRIRQVYYT